MSALTRLTAAQHDALENYHLMQHERDEAINRADSVSASNAALIAEIGVLREQLTRADAERIRVSTIASTLLGRLMSIHDTISGAVKAAREDSIEAAKAPEPMPVEPPAAVYRPEVNLPAETPTQPEASPQAPEAIVGAIGKVPAVDWGPPIWPDRLHPTDPQ